MSLAMENASGSVFELTESIISEGLEASRLSPRLRMLYPIHREQSDPVQRMINFMQRNTYIQPHRHPENGASETVVVLRGRLGFLRFNEDGCVHAAYQLGVGSLFDIIPGIWHSMVALAPDTVIAEFKRGPYSDRDKVFADWAPAEGEAETDSYLQFMESCFEKKGELD